MHAFNAATGELWLGTNGTWISGDPATGTDPFLTLDSSIPWSVAISAIVLDTYAFNIRSNTYSYTPPSGFSVPGVAVSITAISESTPSITTDGGTSQRPMSLVTHPYLQ